MEFVVSFIVIPEAIAHVRFRILIAHFGNLIKDNRYTGILARQVLIRVSLAAWDRSFPLHPAIFLRILSIRGWTSSLLNFS
jgi:hypothetical protein